MPRPLVLSFLIALGLAQLPTLGVAQQEQLSSPTPPAPTAPSLTQLQAEFDAAFAVLMRGDLAGGVRLIEPVLKRSQQALGDRDAFTLKVHDYYGGALMRLARLAEARREFEFELILQRHAEAGSAKSRGALASLNNLGNVVARMESPEASLPVFAQAMALRSEVLGEEDLESAIVLADYGWALGECGRLHEALPLLEKSVLLSIKLHGERHSWSLTARNNLGHMLAQLGRYADALAVHEKVLALRLQESGERHPSTLVSMSNTALMLRYLGRAEEARLLHQRAVDLQTATLGRHHYSTLTSRRGLAADLLALGRVDEAQVSLHELLEDSLKAYGPKHRHAQNTRMELALALEGGQRHAEALDLLDQTLAIYQETAGAEHFNTLETATRRARVLRHLGRAPEACEALLPIQARLKQQYGPSFALTLTATAELASCHQALGEWVEAEQLLAGLVEAGESRQQSVPAGRSQERSLQHAELSRAYRQRALGLAQMGQLEQSFAMLERSKARSLLEQMAERGNALAAGVSAEQWSQLQVMRERTHSLEARLREAKTPPARQSLLAEREGLAQEIAAQQARLREQHPRYTRLTQLAPAAASQAAVLLPPQALLVSYLMQGEGELSAMTLDASGQVQWHPLGRSDAGLADAVESLRLWSTQTARPGSANFFDEAGQALRILHWQEAEGQPRWRVVALAAPACQATRLVPCPPSHARAVSGPADYAVLRRYLSQRLLAPMQARLAGHRQWLISPDQVLGLLPFDLLEWQGRELGAQVVLSQVQSLSALQAGRAVLPPEKVGGLALLAMGNPEFGPQGTTAAEAGSGLRRGDRAATRRSPSSGEGQVLPDPANAASWPPLPGSQAEMMRAAAQFRGQPTRILSGRLASEARLRQASTSGELAAARYLLLATHAWFSPTQVGAARLVLRGEGPGDLQDGLLNTGDLIGLRMASQLVVLSACNTARADAASLAAEQHGGAGQFGFAYALSVAGNRNALLTLWPVHDAATADFMARFFARLARGVPQADALALTKRDFMQHPQEHWRAPQYWAGFVLYGV